MVYEDSNSCKESVYKTLFKEYAPSVFRFIYGKSGDESFAEDLVQDAFLKLWQKCKDIPPLKAKSFLFTTASNLFLDTKRREKVVLKFQTQHRATTNVSQESPEFKLEEKEFKTKLEKIISEMPEKNRTVFLMNRIDKMPYREIAENLGLSQKGVEKRMSVALNYLRKYLNQKI